MTQLENIYALKNAILSKLLAEYFNNKLKSKLYPRKLNNSKLNFKLFPLEFDDSSRAILDLSFILGNIIIPNKY